MNNFFLIYFLNAQRVRLGLNYKSFRFGPALNVQYFGKDAINNYNLGGFVNFLIN